MNYTKVISECSDAEIWDLYRMPNYRDLPAEMRRLKELAELEFKRRGIKLHWIISAIPKAEGKCYYQHKTNT